MSVEYIDIEYIELHYDEDADQLVCVDVEEQ
jgi:hypothetical protein